MTSATSMKLLYPKRHWWKPKEQYDNSAGRPAREAYWVATAVGEVGLPARK
jgi:hypothetical protein